MFAVLTLGNRIGGIVFDVAGNVGISIFIGCVRNGELMPAVDAFFEANVAAVSRSFPPPLRISRDMQERMGKYNQINE